MGSETKIEWCDATFNAWMGCQKVSPGCENCYAEAWAKRFGLVEWGPGKPRRRTNAAKWREVERWDREAGGFLNEGLPYDPEMYGGQPFHRPRVFLGSLMDWLDPDVDIRWRRDMIKLIHACKNLDFLMLTKRPHLFESLMRDVADMALDDDDPYGPCFDMVEKWVNGTPPPNVWVGTSVEDQQRADERIIELLKIPAKVRFLSGEPLLGAIEIFPSWDGPKPINQPINWVIVGGESGPGHRPMQLEWMGGIIGQCQDAGVPVFVKQDSGPKPGQQGRIPDEWWALKEFPKAADGGKGEA